MSDCCSGGVKLIYSCSGSADVGELTDHVARKLRDEGFGKMTCLAGVGAGLSGFVESAKGADENITIDGCQIQCARKALERIGVTPASFVLTDMGFSKGESSVTGEAVDKIVSLIKYTQPRAASGGCCCGGCC